MATTTNFEREQAWAASFTAPQLTERSSIDRAKRFASARRHTIVVRFLRRVLPICAAGIVVLYLGVVLKTGGFVAGLPKVVLPNIIPDNLEMANPHYQGFNSDGGSYVVNAKTAVQDLKDVSLIRLNDITGTLTDPQKVKTNLKAAHGLYNSKTELLELFDGIDIVSENGMHAILKRATIINKQNLIVSKEPVTVNLPTGKITSKEMTLRNKSREVTFLNDVVAHLIPDQSKPAAPAPAKDAATTASGSKAPPLLSATNGPIDVTSNRLDINDNAKTAVFSGNVRAVQGDAALESATLNVSYEGQGVATAAPSGAAPSGATTKIKRISSSTPVVMTRAPNDRVTGKALDYDALSEVAVVTGDVVMTSQSDRRVTSDVATIDQKADTILLTGNVVAIQGRNQLGGGRLFVERATGRTHLTTPGNGDAHGRINSRFYRTDAKTQPSKQWQNAFTSGSPTSAVFKTDPAAPIDVEADRLDVDDRAKEAVYKGEVFAKQGEFTVRTAELHALYTGQAGLADQKTSGGQQQPAAQLTRIEARGKVIVTSKAGHTATGDWANYDVKSNKVTVGGDVVLTQDKNVVRGTRLLIDMTTGESVLQNDPMPGWSATAAPSTAPTSPGFVVQKPTPGSRPSAIFYPRRKENETSHETAHETPKPAQPAPAEAAPGSAIGDGWQGEGPAAP
jgi:lipopolysaccharide transport protein LptA